MRLRWKWGGLKVRMWSGGEGGSGSEGESESERVASVRVPPDEVELAVERSRLEAKESSPSGALQQSAGRRYVVASGRW